MHATVDSHTQHKKGMYMLVYAYMDRQGGKVDRHMHVYAGDTDTDRQQVKERQTDTFMHVCTLNDRYACICKQTSTTTNKKEDREHTYDKQRHAYRQTDTHIDMVACTQTQVKERDKERR